MHAEARAIEVAGVAEGWGRGRRGVSGERRKGRREPLSEFQMALEVAVLSFFLFSLLLACSPLQKKSWGGKMK